MRRLNFQNLTDRLIIADIDFDHFLQRGRVVVMCFWPRELRDGLNAEKLSRLKTHKFNTLDIFMMINQAFEKSLIMNIFKLRFIERYCLSISLGKEKDKLIYC